MDKAVEEDLKAFIEKVDKLEGLSFLKTLKRGTKIHVHLKNNIPKTVRFDGPSDEQTEAYTLTYRLFAQDNDRISVARISNIIDHLPLDQELKKRFSDLRTCLNKYLDGPSGQVVDGEKLTRRRIVDVFVYGNHAHLKRSKKAEYDSWAENETLFAVLKNKFVWALGYVLDFHLCYMREICKDALLAHGVPWFKIPPPPPPESAPAIGSS